MPPPNQLPFDPKDHLLPPASRSPIGPIVGISIITALSIVGALYFWGAVQNTQKNPIDTLPLIPGDGSTLQ